MNRITLLAIVLIAGCSAQQLQTLQQDEQRAEQVYAATTQATVAAKTAVATLPANSAAAQNFSHVVQESETVEHTARVALDLAQAALEAAQKKDATDPKLATAVSAAISAIPS